MGEEIATITLWNYAALVVIVISFCVLNMKANRATAFKLFSVVVIAMIIWLVGKIFKTVSPNIELRWFFIVFYYFGICLLGASFLDFAYAYGKGKLLGRKIRITIYSFALIEFLIVLTNPYHMLFYSEFTFSHDEFGLLFYVHVAINYVFICLGMVFCAIKFSKQKKGRLQKYLIGSAILLPIILNFIYITRLLQSLFEMLDFQIFDVTPIVYTWSLLIFVYATFKHEFFDLTPVMKHEVTSKLNTPLLIVDSDGEKVFENKEFERLFAGFDSPEVKQHRFNKDTAGQSGVMMQNGKYYHYTQSLVRNISTSKYIISFYDVTRYETAKRDLNVQTKQMEKVNIELKEQIEALKQTSIVGARSYVARELHDIIGHSLVVTMKLLEVAKITNDIQKIKATLDKSKDCVLLGLNEMKGISSNKNDRNKHNFRALKRELQTMLRGVRHSGIDVNLFVDDGGELDERVFDIVKRVCTELLTNTLKHANASIVLLSVKMDKNVLSVQFMDNGDGANRIVKGNGLKGIDDRLALLGGNAEFQTSKGEGFWINISIPYSAK